MRLMIFDLCSDSNREFPGFCDFIEHPSNNAQGLVRPLA